MATSGSRHNENPTHAANERTALLAGHGPSHGHGIVEEACHAEEGQQDIEEEDSEPDAGSSKSPFLGVGVIRFWLIFGGILANYFVAFFDSTVSTGSLYLLCYICNAIHVHTQALTPGTPRLWSAATQSLHRTFKAPTVHLGCPLHFC
jgi:hypothetical protein